MQKLARIIEQKAVETKFSGVISIFKKNSAIYNNAFLYRDAKNRLLNDTKTKFGIASGTKIFTALGIGKLIDQGKLSFDTKIKKISNNFSSFIDEKATILNLLTHTSGIYDYYDEELIDTESYFVEIPWYKLETPSDYYPLFQNKKMKFRANERYAYSNGGYVFLGIIIEKVTGLLYRDFIKENVLQPAKMKNSGFYALNDLPENTANGYLKDRKTVNIFNIPMRGGGDGGMYTTTEDLRFFWAQLFSYKILPQKLTKDYLKPHHKFDNENGYGCGIYKKTDDSLFTISGGDSCVGFYSGYMPKEELTINIFSNITDGEEKMRDEILKILSSIK